MAKSAEEKASQNAQASIEYATPEELTANYITEDIITSYGRKFKVASALPGNLMIDIGSPMLESFLRPPENDDEKLLPREEYTIYQNIKNFICNHVVSVDLSPQPQHLCPPEVVSTDRLPREEVVEIFEHIKRLSEQEAATFQETRQ